MVHPQLACFAIATFLGISRWHPNRASNLKKWLRYALPTKEEEESSPVSADTKYKSAIGSLLEATRDTSKFPLVFAENANYGFRRNLWGLRPIGTPIAVVLALGSWTFAVVNHMGATLAKSMVGRFREF